MTDSRSILRTTTTSGTSVYDHLSSLLLKIVQEKPADPVAAFEQLSVQLKKERLNANGGASKDGSGILGVDLPSSKLVTSAKSKESLLSQLQKTSDFLKKPKKFDEEGNEIEEEEEEMNQQAPDLMHQQEMWKEAGISLSPFELYRLSSSVQTLCNTTPSLTAPRFWGKIYGSAQDYYIVEGKVDDPSFADEEDEEENEEEKVEDAAGSGSDGEDGGAAGEEAPTKVSRTEPWGIGANEYVYYVSNTVSGPWSRLPKVTPEQIIVARKVRRYFTGSLTAPVFGLPRFAWSEASLLRTQIARITASTTLAPKGFYLSDEEEQLIALENEEFRGLRASSLLQPSNWVHSRPKLLGEGRVEKFIDESKEDEEVDEDELEPLEREKRKMLKEKEEKIVPILTSVERDGVKVGKKKEKKGKKKQQQESKDAASEDASSSPAASISLWKFSLNTHVDSGLKRIAKSRAPGAAAQSDEDTPDVSTTHSIATAKSLLWPGAITLVRGKEILPVYVGYGLKCEGKNLHASSSSIHTYRPSGPAMFQKEYNVEEVNEKGVKKLEEQSDPFPPSAEKDTRTAEEKESDAAEEVERLARQEAEENEPVEELDDEEEEEKDRRKQEEEED